MTDRKKSTRKFKADVSRVLHLVVNSLYSHREIFLRELISNASDAIDRLQHRSLTEEGLLGAEEKLAVRIWADEERGLLHIEDNGSGMTFDELATNLGTVAHSGTQKFLEQLEAAGRSQDARFIGQFGVGFYSAFLVADRVTVLTKAAGSDEAWAWESDAEETYTLTPAEREGRGTSITLHLKEDQKEYLQFHRLQQVIRQYSDYVGHPIFLGPQPAWMARQDAEQEEGDDKPVVLDEFGRLPRWGLPLPEGDFGRVNEASALWQRPKEEVTDEQYQEFYKHLTHDWDEPAAWNHFKIEGTQLFTGLLFLPKNPPFDLFSRDTKRGVRLFVKRVFIMDDAEELVPVWLRFMRGVIDSDDLPLNVSRETLQDSSVVRSIRKQVTKKSLDLLVKLSNDDAEAYAAAWDHYGRVIKEGLHMAPEFKKQLAELVRWRSSGADGLTSLEAYVERMPEGQEAIYYVLGESEAAVKDSPHLEALRKKGYEVLYMTDPIDEWAVQGLGEYDDKKLVSAMRADLDLEQTEEEKEQAEARQEELQDLVGKIKEVLGGEVEEVRLSSRLTDSPACLVVPEGANHAFLDRILRAHDGGQGMPRRRILEINPTHPLIANLETLHKLDAEAVEVTEWIEVLYDQVLLTEGSPVSDPNRLARRMTALMQRAAVAAVADREQGASA